MRWVVMSILMFLCDSVTVHFCHNLKRLMLIGTNMKSERKTSHNCESWWRLSTTTKSALKYIVSSSLQGQHSILWFMLGWIYALDCKGYQLFRHPSVIVKLKQCSVKSSVYVLLSNSKVSYILFLSADPGGRKLLRTTVWSHKLNLEQKTLRTSGKWHQLFLWMKINI